MTPQTDRLQRDTNQRPWTDSCVAPCSSPGRSAGWWPWSACLPMAARGYQHDVTLLVACNVVQAVYSACMMPWYCSVLSLQACNRTERHNFIRPMQSMPSQLRQTRAQGHDWKAVNTHLLKVHIYLHTAHDMYRSHSCSGRTVSSHAQGACSGWQSSWSPRPPAGPGSSICAAQHPGCT